MAGGRRHDRDADVETNAAICERRASAPQPDCPRRPARATANHSENRYTHRYSLLNISEYLRLNTLH
ncbi:hypothetical protein NO135_22680 [Clostridioides difficile]|nr:hypothetical protein [Clostridioides difficile]